MTQESIRCLLDSQKAFFRQGDTLSHAFRCRQLEALYKAILSYADKLEKALKTDLGKSAFESYTSEIGIVLSSLTYAKKHLKGWMKPQKVPTALPVFPGKSRVECIPFGSVLILGPYNYPVQLLMEPLIGAIAAGNCAVLSPSELTPSVAAVVREMIQATFDPSYICCVEGGVENNTLLLQNRFDYLFFTGSARVGKLVMKAAAEHLIPVTLELGGKSPVLVDSTAKLPVACERILWGKLMNAGQTCVAPDYVLVDRQIFQPFIEELERGIRRFYGEDIQSNPDYGRIVNERHMERLIRILDQDRACIRFGGKVDREDRYIEPAILCPDSLQAACMQEELFGPLLPVFPYDNLSDALDIIARQETPLAFYVFSEDRSFIRTALRRIPSGGASINDTVSHLLNPHLPFGGKGSSGMGAYHGKRSFLTFSHQRSILRRSTRIPVRLAFPPYTPKKQKWIRRILK